MKKTLKRLICTVMLIMSVMTFIGYADGYVSSYGLTETFVEPGDSFKLNGKAKCENGEYIRRIVVSVRKYDDEGHGGYLENEVDFDLKDQITSYELSKLGRIYTDEKYTCTGCGKTEKFGEGKWYVVINVGMHNGAKGCSSKKVLTIEQEIDTSKNEFEFEAKGGKETVEIYASCDYTIKATESWVTVSDSSGNSDKKITITCKENTDTEERMAYVRIISKNDSDNYARINIYQDGSDHKEYEVTYNANGGKNAPDDETVDGTFKISGDVPTRSGYTFLGWATSKNGKVVYKPKDKVQIDDDLNLYAVWEANEATTYTIKYNANGGSGAPSSQTKTEGVAIYLSSTEPSRSGYTFEGWATSSSGSVKYLPGAKYTADSNVTLYAVWEKTVQTDYAVKSITASSSSVKVGENITFTIKTGLDCEKVVLYADGTKFATVTSSTTSSSYKTFTYKYQFNSAGSSRTIKAYAIYNGKEQSGYKSVSVTVTQATYKLSAFTVNKATATVGSSAIVSWTASVPQITGTKVQYHVYVDNELCDKTYNTSYTVSKSVINDLGAGTYSVMVIATADSHTTCQAANNITIKEKELKTYTIKYNANGGSGAPSSQTKTEGVAIYLSSTEPSRSGYTFEGWATSSSGSVKYLPGAKYTADSNVTLYAVWEKEECQHNLSETTKKVKSEYSKITGDDSYHNCIDYYNVICACGEVKESYTMTSKKSHSYSNNKCTVCGYTKTVTVDYAVKSITADKSTVQANLDLVTFTVKAGLDCEKIVFYADNNKFGTVTPKSKNSSYQTFEYPYMFNGTGTRTVKAYAIYNGEEQSSYKSISIKVTPATYTLSAFTVNKATATIGSSATISWTASKPQTSGTKVQYHVYVDNKIVDTTYNTSYTLSKSTINDLGVGTYSVTIIAMADNHEKLQKANNITIIACQHTGSTTSKKTKITYEKISGDDNYHNYVTYYDDICNNCGKVAESRTEKSKQSHSYSSNKCTACGYTKAEEKASLSVSKNTLSFVAKESKQTFIITSNTNYMVAGSTGWIRTDTTGGSGNKTVTVICAENKTQSSRTGRVNIYVEGKIYAYVEIVQAAGEVAAKTYTITYDANGGSPNPASQTKVENKTLYITSTRPTKTGHTFIGWSPSKNATTAQYESGDSYTANSNITLYAVWEEKKEEKVYIKFYANGGYNAPADISGYKGQSVNITYDEPTRDGYTFLGWSENSDATYASYTKGSSVTLNKDMKLYAVWDSEETVYSDVKNDHWAKAAIEYVKKKGLIDPKSKDIFDPEGDMTREAFVTALARLSNVTSNYIEWAKETKLLKGDGKGNYNLNDTVDRAEMCAFVYRYIFNSGYNPQELLIKDVPVFADNYILDTNDYNWAKENIYTLCKMGVVKGKTNGKFEPQALMTRAECAQVLKNLDEALQGKKKHTHDFSTEPEYKTGTGKWNANDGNTHTRTYVEYTVKCKICGVITEGSFTNDVTENHKFDTNTTKTYSYYDETYHKEISTEKKKCWVCGYSENSGVSETLVEHDFDGSGKCKVKNCNAVQSKKRYRAIFLGTKTGILNSQGVDTGTSSIAALIDTFMLNNYINSKLEYVRTIAGNETKFLNMIDEYAKTGKDDDITYICSLTHGYTGGIALWTGGYDSNKEVKYSFLSYETLFRHISKIPGKIVYISGACCSGSCIIEAEKYGSKITVLAAAASDKKTYGAEEIEKYAYETSTSCLFLDGIIASYRYGDSNNDGVVTVKESFDFANSYIDEVADNIRNNKVLPPYSIEDFDIKDRISNASFAALLEDQDPVFSGTDTDIPLFGTIK